MSASGDRSDDFRIETLSAKPHLVSGGDVLVRIDIPERLDRRDVRVELNGRNITGAFRAESKDALVGLVQGLKLGRNELEVSRSGRGRGHGGRAERLVLTNWPIAGPITAGPHQEPFFCQTHQFLLSDGTPYTATPAAQPDCSAPTRITYMYRAVGGAALVPLPSTTTLPPNVAMTTTTTGSTVRFIVRVGTSTVDRGIYQSAVLHDPTVDAAPSQFSPPRGWNRRLIAVEGYGCPGGWYIQGAAIGSLSLSGMDFNLLSPARLGEGYAMFSNTLQHPSNNCNSVLAGEAAMMSKERFIETYGAPRYTVSAGCSGGSYGSIQLADQLPGLFDGALIACTFPDPLSIALSGSDGHLLANYFASNPAALTNAQKDGDHGIQVLGSRRAAGVHRRGPPVRPHRSGAGTRLARNPGLRVRSFHRRRAGCRALSPRNQPARGARHRLRRGEKRVWRRRAHRVRAAPVRRRRGAVRPEGAERRRHHAAAVPGPQRAHRRLRPGREFRRLPFGRRHRRHPPPYQSGLQFVGSGGLSSIPLVDITGIHNDDSGYHYQWFHFATRDRMKQANGDTRNHIMWRGSVPFNGAWSNG